MRSRTAALDLCTLYADRQPTAADVLAAVTAAFGGVAPIEMWDARFNVALSGSAIISISGLVNAWALTAPGVPNRPSFAVDGSNFMSRPLIRPTAVTQALNSADLGAIIPIGGRPYVWILARRTGAGGRLWQLNKDTTLDTQVMFLLHNSGTSGLQRATQQGGATQDQTTSMGTNVALYESWLDASIGERSATNGVEATANAVATAGVAFAVHAVNLSSVGGGATNGLVQYVAQIGISAAPPTAPQRAALLALQRSHWAF
jgi:hypothetical protein